MNLFGVLGISASGLQAERQRAEVVAANLANAETTRTPEGGPYRRRQVIFAAQGKPQFGPRLAMSTRELSSARGVEIRDVVADPSMPGERFDPSHPDANEKGYVAYPNINPVAEMVDLMSAVRSYQMNAAAVNASKQMIQQSIEILR
ncbi:MAG TPA: flagellar basal body rod protein FlgC [Clostridia bacterium]|nr:flagellar basal body rod protein FlgC [Clostridia bacterium]